MSRVVRALRRRPRYGAAVVAALAGTAGLLVSPFSASPFGPPRARAADAADPSPGGVGGAGIGGAGVGGVVAGGEGGALLGPVAGAATVLAALGAGGTLFAQDGRPDRQRAGAYVLLGGFAAAPLVSHVAGGRWRRGLAFGLGSVATTLGALAAMRAQDPFDPSIANHDRLAFGTLLTASFFAAAVGVADSFIFPSERPPRW